MKGRIDNLGNLEIVRGDQWVTQMCPYCPDNYRFCGHWCPMFGDPKNGMRHGKSYVYLGLCRKELTFDEFEDMRGK